MGGYLDLLGAVYIWKDFLFIWSALDSRVYIIYESESKILSRRLHNEIQKYFGLRDNSPMRFFWFLKEKIRERPFERYL